MAKLIIELFFYQCNLLAELWSRTRGCCPGQSSRGIGPSNVSANEGNRVKGQMRGHLGAIEKTIHLFELFVKHNFI